MVVVIRLHGLKITAGSEDIRSFFTGLRIPDGGVHIIGGELGEAFIIFASDEDARRAMTRSGGFIKGSKVNLLLSSRSEMQKVLEESTRASESNKKNYKDVTRRPAVGGRPMLLKENMKGDLRRGDNENMENGFPLSSPSDFRAQNNAGDRIGLYLYMFGMPFSATQEDVRVFFDDVQFEDLIFMRNKYGTFNGCGLVKFRTREDAIEGLKKDRKYIGKRYIRVVPASENQWVKCGGTVISKGASQRSRTRSRSPVRHRSHSPANEEFGVLYENLPYGVEKRDIKALLHPVSLIDDQISILVDKNNDRSKSAIVVFNNLKDYCSGLAHHKETFLHRVISVSPVSREKIGTMLKSTDIPREIHRSSSRSLERSQSVHESEKQCMYVRNLPFDVRKVEIMDFFHGFQLSEDRIILLHDDRGSGLGEALVIFQSEKEAVLAQALNGQRFLGSEVMLKCITWAQMQEFGIDNSYFPKRNSPRYGGEPNFFNDQMYQDNSGITPDVPNYNPGNSGPLDHFENPVAFEREPHGPVPHQYKPANQQFNRPACVRLLNLPVKIMVDEIYDFCYGYRVIPGSVSLQYNKRGAPTGTATVVFESHSEAVTAVQELNGRPIGMRKINMVLV
ncbi:RNA-binding protein 12B [Bagarius yarrelli]|uniref:RNA-binding protein 12B n=1 Tax=Bagarius yarrelli TaxID=175774 RepID=A0A556VAM8_BAGYA|nr:RNA-binding protein 12B [Bagarius yarrelli]